MAEFEPLYVAARRVLLDALEALAAHREALIVAGAQAVYLRTGDTALSVAPYTTDGDVALDPEALGLTPDISAAMGDAGFHDVSGSNPGAWIASVDVEGRQVDIPIDLLVPEAVASGTRRRSAQLKGHSTRTARKVSGIEAVLVDNDWMTIGALKVADPRQIQSRVAGPTALLIAKAHKINDRLTEARAHRQDDKDALDAYRLMQTTPIATVGAVLPRLLEDKRTEVTTRAGVELIVGLFGARRSPGVEMALRALQGSVPEARVQTVCTAFVDRLREI